MLAPFNYITTDLNITKAVAKECSQSGDNSYNVEYYINLPYYKKQLSKIDKDELVKELNDYGAWEDEELTDHNENLKRIFWIKCGDIVEIYLNK
jgi:hypothetical protein